MLPVTRPLLSGESLSSWIVRIADLHGMSVQQLSAWLMGRGRQAFNDDVDRGAWTELLEALARATNQPVATLRAGTLLAYEGLLWGELAPQGPARWLLPIVKRGTFRTGFGLQYCAACLAADAVPHMRLHWRLAYVVACERHGCLLRDRCDRCEEPVAPHRWRTGPLRDLGSSGIVRCHACGADRRFPLQHHKASASVLRLQQQLLGAMDQGGLVMNDRVVHVLAVFPGVAMLLSLLDDAREITTVWPVLELAPPDFVKAAGTRYGSFERREVGERAELLQGLAAVWATGPEKFLRRLAARRVSSHRLLRYSTRLKAPAPYWYASLVKGQLDRSMYVPSDEEIDGAIHHLMARSSAGLVSIREVCSLLGMATNNSARVARRLREHALKSAAEPSPRARS